MKIKDVINKYLKSNLPAIIAISSYAPLILYQHNIFETHIQSIFKTLFICVLFGVSSYLLFFKNLIKDQNKSFIAVWIFIVLFFSFGHIYLTLAKLLGSYEILISPNKIVIGAYLAIFILLTLVAVSKIKLDKLATYLKIVTFVLMFMIAVNIIPTELNSVLTESKIRQYKANNFAPLTYQNHDKSTYPDIYYVIFDRYARQDIYSKYFDYKNDQEAWLTDNMFQVRSDSYANYPTTFLSLSSSLNMTHLSDLTKIIGTSNRDRFPLYQQLIKNNRVTEFLKERGYKYYFIGSSWDGTKSSDLADENINLWQDVDRILLFVYDNTLLNALLGILLNKQTYIGIYNLQKHVENGRYKKEALLNLPKRTGPKFVFAHFLVPHPPNVFSQNCQPVDFEILRSRPEEENYINEVGCANKIMRELVSAQSENSKRPSIIIFQSDEGPYLPTKIFTDGQQFSKPPTSAQIGIHAPNLLSAYAQETSYTKNITKKFELPKTPVNLFGEVLNYYFGTRISKLEDRSYTSKDPDRPYDFYEITSQID